MLREEWAAAEYSTTGGAGGGGVHVRVERRERGGSNDAFPSAQVERITITIKNQKACVSIKRLPVTLCVPTVEGWQMQNSGLIVGLLPQFVRRDIMQ